MDNKLTAVFAKISNADEKLARLNALLHLTFDHVSGGGLDDPDMETIGWALLMARQELDAMQKNHTQLHEAYKALRIDVENVYRNQARRELEPPAPIAAKQRRETADAPRIKKVA